MRVGTGDEQLSELKKTISIEWSTNDVKCVRPDLTEEQCSEVLECTEESHDANEGINWIVLETHADNLFPMDRKIANQVRNFEGFDYVGVPFEEIDAAWKKFISPKLVRPEKR